MPYGSGVVLEKKAELDWLSVPLLMGKVSVRIRMLLKKQTKKYYNNLDYKVNLNNYDLVFKFKIIQLKNKEKIKRLKQFWFLTLKKIFFQID